MHPDDGYARRGFERVRNAACRERPEPGLYPRYVFQRSLSRVISWVPPTAQLAAARRARQLLARYNKARDLIQLGAYSPGHDPELDAAVRVQPALVALLQQDMHAVAPLATSQRQLAETVQSV